MASADNAEKSASAFRTISEVAAELGVAQHVLRFWETRFVQVKPLKRRGGRRFYRPEDVALLKGIRHLLYDEGLTIKGAQKYLREHGVKSVSALGEIGAPALTGEEAEAAAHAVERSEIKKIITELKEIRAGLAKLV